MDCPQIRRSFSGRNIGRSHLAKISSEYLFITGPAFFIVPIFIAQDPVKFITLKKKSTRWQADCNKNKSHEL